jgi:hypothetical protein
MRRYESETIYLVDSILSEKLLFFVLSFFEVCHSIYTKVFFSCRDARVKESEGGRRFPWIYKSGYEVRHYQNSGIMPLNILL